MERYYDEHFRYECRGAEMTEEHNERLSEQSRIGYAQIRKAA